MQVVAAVIKSNEGLILITQRGKGMSFVGKWEFPGGKVHEGEGPTQALKREIKEELCLDIDVEVKLLEWSYEYSFGKVDFIAYDSKINNGNLNLVEHMDSQWVKPFELKNYDWVPADVVLVEKLTGGLT
jgi:8-oxo-dGTP diphosphatase